MRKNGLKRWVTDGFGGRYGKMRAEDKATDEGGLFGSIEPTCLFNWSRHEPRPIFTREITRGARCQGSSKHPGNASSERLALRFCEALEPHLASLEHLLKILHKTCNTKRGYETRKKKGEKEEGTAKLSEVPKIGTSYSPVQFNNGLFTAW